jgi:hypothetical protein
MYEVRIIKGNNLFSFHGYFSLSALERLLFFYANSTSSYLSNSDRLVSLLVFYFTAGIFGHWDGCLRIIELSYYNVKFEGDDSLIRMDEILEFI